MLTARNPLTLYYNAVAELCGSVQLFLLYPRTKIQWLTRGVERFSASPALIGGGA